MKTSELTGVALNLAVARCAGYRLDLVPEDSYTPSTDWSQGGPIIEREGISTVQQGDASEWVASVYNYNEGDWHLHTTGPTPLIAAMRCYVASKLGDEVEVPDELH
jgi:hypothetical protein